MADMTSYQRHPNHLVDIDELRSTGSGAMTETINIPRSFKVCEVRLHLGSAATQEDFQVAMSSGTSVVYDTVLFTADMSQDLNGNAGVVTDVVWRPEEPALVHKADSLSISWVNTDAATWGLTVIIEADSA